MAKLTVSLRVRVAWWVQPYIAGVKFCALVTGLEPDMEQVERVVVKGLRVESVCNG